MQFAEAKNCINTAWKTLSLQAYHLDITTSTVVTSATIVDNFNAPTAVTPTGLRSKHSGYWHKAFNILKGRQIDQKTLSCKITADKIVKKTVEANNKMKNVVRLTKQEKGSKNSRLIELKAKKVI